MFQFSRRTKQRFLSPRQRPSASLRFETLEERITPAAPVVIIHGPKLFNTGVIEQFTFEAKNVGVNDQVRYNIDWEGDGKVDESHLFFSSGGAAYHKYEQPGSYDLTITITSKKYGPSQPAVYPVKAKVAFVRKNELYVSGTDKGDVIRILPTKNPKAVSVVVNGKSQGRFHNLQRVIIQALNGNDNVRLDGVKIGSYVDAGSGNDVVVGGSKKDVIDGSFGNDFLYGVDGDDELFGGDGSDLLRGGNGNDYLSGDDEGIFFDGGGSDILTGGAGNDKLVGTAGHDIFIGGDGSDIMNGYYAGDDEFDGPRASNSIYIGGNIERQFNDAALLALMREWRSDHSFETRVKNLTMGGGLNGKFTLKPKSDLINDHAPDTFLVGFNPDWIFVSKRDRVKGVGIESDDVVSHV